MILSRAKFFLVFKVMLYRFPSLVKDEEESLAESSYREYDNSMISGFQLATSAGPLCEEPLMGVCFVIEDIVIDYRTQGELDVDKLDGHPCLEGKSVRPSFPKEESKEIQNPVQQTDMVEKEKEEITEDFETDNKLPSRQTLFGILSGQIISAVKDGCRQAFLLQPARLMAAMYTCNIQTPADVLGKMYGVIAKREGKVLDEEMKEGSDVFIVNAVLPVAESFGFTEEIRKRTSGLARPLLQFTHWEVSLYIVY